MCGFVGAETVAKGHEDGNTKNVGNVETNKSSNSEPKSEALDNACDSSPKGIHLLKDLIDLHICHSLVT